VQPVRCTPTRLSSSLRARQVHKSPISCCSLQHNAGKVVHPARQTSRQQVHVQSECSGQGAAISLAAPPQSGMVGTKRKAACVGEVKKAAKLARLAGDQGVHPIDLLEAWGDEHHRLHEQAVGVIGQIFTYLVSWEIFYGFVSCFFGTWLVFVDLKHRQGMYVSHVYLATSASPNVTTTAALA